MYTVLFLTLRWDTTSGNHTLVSRRSQTPSVVLVGGGGGGVFGRRKKVVPLPFLARVPLPFVSPLFTVNYKRSRLVASLISQFLATLLQRLILCYIMFNFHIGWAEQSDKIVGCTDPQNWNVRTFKVWLFAQFTQETIICLILLSTQVRWAIQRNQLEYKQD